ncbi:cyclin-D4-1-like [Neltuma alba]|uniref:cyclin-D4-1-like n=1 Tax=Neltuma alba TaxID=207710 RepID=UPI0010A2E665|nr:cyclin-D4-1-like [Prosopis alba]XP_028802239.1 cyclin-D4-1-like [Prosopis alba]
MAPSFDCVSALLCAEDDSIFDDGDYGATMEPLDVTRGPRNHNLCFHDRHDGLPLQSDECLAQMVQKECDHLPAGDYLNRLRTADLDFGARKEAVDWIEKVREHFGFSPLCTYLSINYLDRFLSSYELPKGKGWTMQLLAVACLSLAAKMEEAEVPLSVDLQVGGSKFVFEARTIQRMELLVLSTLRWRMQAITPFSFIDYFLFKLNDDQKPEGSSISRSIQIISSTARGVDLLEFRPSEVAAAVAICVVRETQTVNTEKAISVLSQHVEKERVVECLKIIKEMASNGREDCVAQSPIGVWEAAALCWSHKSEGSSSCGSSSSSRDGPDPKRIKLNNTSNSGVELL